MIAYINRLVGITLASISFGASATCAAVDQVSSATALVIATKAAPIAHWESFEVRVKVEKERFWVFFAYQPSTPGTEFSVELDRCGSILETYPGL